MDRKKSLFRMNTNSYKTFNRAELKDRKKSTGLFVHFVAIFYKYFIFISFIPNRCENHDNIKIQFSKYISVSKSILS